MVTDSTAASTLEVRGMGARLLADGSTYDEVTLNGIPPWSMGVVTLSITNTGGAPLSVESVALEPVAPTDPYEWAFTQPGNVARVPFTFMPQTLMPRSSTSVGVHFIPIASGPRPVRFVVRYGGGRTYTVTIAGRGRDNLTLSPVVSSSLERLFGRSNLAGSNRAAPGAVVADAAGNMYLNLNVNQWSDRFSHNVALARVNANGSLGWVRELNEQFTQESSDIGNNGEVGGNPTTLAIDSSGSLYLSFNRSIIVQNSIFQAGLMRVSSATGAVSWAVGYDTMAGGMKGEAVDASLADRVIIAGAGPLAAQFFIAAVRKSDASVIWARTITHAGTSRVGSIDVLPDGTAFVGGISNNTPFLARFNGVNGESPSLAWMQSLGVFGSHIRGLTASTDGVLAAINVRGASTTFVGARFAAATGNRVWSFGFVASNADRNNTMTVAEYNGQAIFAGRMGVQPFDPTGGDGFLMSLNPTTGAWNWGSVYYGGRGAEEAEFTHITGLFPTSQGLVVLSHQTPAAQNRHHHYGRWYQTTDDTLMLPGGTGSMRLQTYPLTMTVIQPTVAPLTTVRSNSFDPTTAGTWLDQTSSVTCDDPVRLEEMNFQTGTHALLQRVTIR
jgi:hypothetical protein